VTIGAGDSKRVRAAPSEAERVRATDTVRRCGREGLLSTREVDEHIEHVFRARTVAELDAAVAALPRTPHIAADIVLTHGVKSPTAPRPQRPWWQGIVIWSVSIELLWVVLWLVFGGSVGYLMLAVISTLTAFLIRAVRRYRTHVTGTKRRRRRL
jgi:hypothetical protein